MNFKTIKEYFTWEKSVFGWIAIISVLNSLLIYINFSFLLVFWLEVTQIFDYIWTEETNLNEKTTYIVITLIISFIFIVINYFSQKGIKWVFIIWFILYFLDAIVCLYLFDILNLFAHTVVLIFLYNFYKDNFKLKN